MAVFSCTYPLNERPLPLLWRAMLDFYYYCEADIILIYFSWITISLVQRDMVQTVQTVNLAINDTSVKKGNSIAQSSPVNFCRVLNSIKTQRHEWKPWRLWLSHLNLASWLSAAAGLRAATYHEAAALATHLLVVSHASASREKHNVIRTHHHYRQLRHTNIRGTGRHWQHGNAGGKVCKLK